MALELFTIDEIRVSFVNSTENFGLSASDKEKLDVLSSGINKPSKEAAMMQKQLTYVLNREVARLCDHIGSKAIPCTPDVIRSISAVAVEFEQISYGSNYKITTSAEISTSMKEFDPMDQKGSKEAEHHTVVTFVVHISEVKATTNSRRYYPTSSLSTDTSDQSSN